MPEIQPRWTLTTITTTDFNVVKIAKVVREKIKIKHEDIYRRGLVEIMKENKIKML